MPVGNSAPTGIAQIGRTEIQPANFCATELTIVWHTDRRTDGQTDGPMAKAMSPNPKGGRHNQRVFNISSPSPGMKHEVQSYEMKVPGFYKNNSIFFMLTSFPAILLV